MRILEIRGVIIGLIYMLNFGRQFSTYFIMSQKNEFEKDMNITNKDIRQLMEWSQWPNMILSVIVGYSLDFVINIKVAMICFSILAMAGQIMFVTAIYRTSNILLSASQILRGVSYESVVIIQMTLIGRMFSKNKLYPPIAIMIFISELSKGAGNYIMPNISLSLLIKSVIVTVPHIISFICAILIFCGIDFDSILLKFDHDKVEAVNKEVCGNEKKKDYGTETVTAASNNNQDFQTENNSDKKEPGAKNNNKILTKKSNDHYTLRFVIILLVAMFYLFPNLPFWFGFNNLLFWKYGLIGSDKFILMAFNFANCTVLLVSGFLLNRFEMKYNYRFCIIIISISTMTMSHCFLIFSFATPIIFIMFIGASTALVNLILKTSLLIMVPRNEYGTAMGFIQAIENLTKAVSGDLIPAIIEPFGYIYMGTIDIFCDIMALWHSVILWYLH